VILAQVALAAVDLAITRRLFTIEFRVGEVPPGTADARHPRLTAQPPSVPTSRATRTVGERGQFVHHR
jgi:hypothetical protein